MNNEERDRYIIETHTAVHANSDAIGRHEKTLYGNGQPGLCTRLKDLEVVARLKAGCGSKWFVGILSVGSAVLGGVVAVVCQALVTKLIN